jgi:hypothetical protein
LNEVQLWFDGFVETKEETMTANSKNRSFALLSEPCSDGLFMKLFQYEKVSLVSSLAVAFFEWKKFSKKTINHRNHQTIGIEDPQTMTDDFFQKSTTVRNPRLIKL